MGSSWRFLGDLLGFGLCEQVQRSRAWNGLAGSLLVLPRFTVSFHSSAPTASAITYSSSQFLCLGSFFTSASLNFQCISIRMQKYQDVSRCVKVFLFRPEELEFFCGPSGGARSLAPSAWRSFSSWLPSRLSSAPAVAAAFRRAALGKDG